jgi:hypothetical protein
VLRHGRLRQVTVDHSFVQELVAEGAITATEARHHPRRNIVTRALGIEPYVRVDTWMMPIIRGDRFLLCSDGLVDEVADDVIQAILAAHPDDPTIAAQALVDAANSSGGRDNITAIVVDVLEGDDPPDPTEEFDVIPAWSDEVDEQTTDGGPAEIVADPLDEDPDRELVPVAAAIALDGDTTTAATDVATEPADAAPSEPSQAHKTRRRRKGRVGRILLALGATAVLVLGFAVLAAYARNLYYVAFDEDGTVAIYQGRDVLWFHPTREAKSNLSRAQLDAESIALVGQEVQFENANDAANFISTSLSVTTTTSTTTTTTTTTTVPTTTTPVAAPPVTPSTGA